MSRTPRDEKTILRIARLRYEDGLLQNEIARELSLSEATVSRHLRLAMEMGLVEDSGARRQTETHRLAIVWRAVDTAKRPPDSDSAPLMVSRSRRIVGSSEGRRG